MTSAPLCLSLSPYELQSLFRGQAPRVRERESGREREGEREREWGRERESEREREHAEVISGGLEMCTVASLWFLSATVLPIII